MSFAARLLTASFALVVCTPLFAQDLFKSTGTSTRSYNYIEAQYLFDTVINVPILATLLLDIDESISITAEYLKQSDSVLFEDFDDDGDVNVDAESTSAMIGLLYHQPLSRQRNIDWVAAVSVGQVEAMAAARGVSLKSTARTHVGYFGLRQSISARLEAEIGARIVQRDATKATVGVPDNIPFDPDTVDTRIAGATDVLVDLKVVYRIAGFFDIALGVQGVSEGDLLGIGFRYTW